MKQKKTRREIIAQATQFAAKKHPDASKFAQACKLAVCLLNEKIDLSFFSGPHANFGSQFETCLYHTVKQLLPQYSRCPNPRLYPDLVNTVDNNLSVEVRLSASSNKNNRNQLKGHPENNAHHKKTDTFYLYVVIDPTKWTLEEVWCGWIPHIAWQKSNSSGHLLKAVKYHYMEKIFG